MHRLLLSLALLTTFATTSLAGTVPLPSDVAVTFFAIPTNNLRTGDSVAFTMTATNNGPASLGFFSIVGPQISNQFYYPATTWNDCNLITITGDGANGPFWILEWNPTGAVGEIPVAPGEIRTCHFTLAVASELPATYSFVVRLGTLWTDPNPANNIATVPLQRAIDATPALSLPSMLLLLGLILIVGGRVLQPHRLNGRFRGRPWNSI